MKIMASDVLWSISREERVCYKRRNGGFAVVIERSDSNLFFAGRADEIMRVNTLALAQRAVRVIMENWVADTPALNLDAWLQEEIRRNPEINKADAGPVYEKCEKLDRGIEKNHTGIDSLKKRIRGIGDHISEMNEAKAIFRKEK